MPRIQKLKPAKSKRLKTPETPPVSFNLFPPIFSLEYLDDDYCISKCNKEEKSSFADTLRIMGKMKWRDLELAPRHGNGKENISVDQIRGKKPPIITPDVSHVFAFRFHDNKPMVGLRIQRIFYIIWLDRSFSLYDHD